MTTENQTPTAQSGPSDSDWMVQAAKHLADAGHGIHSMALATLAEGVRTGRVISTPPAGARDAAIDHLLKVAKNYIRCASHESLSPYVRENSIRGSTSPWAEFIEAVQAVDRAIPTMKAITGKADQ